VTAWDVNCPRHIPRKLDAAQVQQHVGRLEQQIAALQRENQALRRQAGAGGAPDPLRGGQGAA
jgi:hypothetical protein